MENSLVSARVPRAKKERATSILAEMGATASDLVNSAYDYVISTRQLPRAELAEERDAKDFAAFVADTTLSFAWPDSGPASRGDYKAFIREQRRVDYESAS